MGGLSDKHQKPYTNFMLMVIVLMATFLVPPNYVFWGVIGGILVGIFGTLWVLSLLV